MYSRALAAKVAGRFEEAALLFFRVPEKEPKYELAQAHGIECLFRLRRFAEARRRIRAYRKYVATHPHPAVSR